MKTKLESSNYDFKTKEEEVSFKARIKDSLDIDVEKFEFWLKVNCKTMS